MDEPVPHCSFCGKKQSDVRRLIAGPGVYICNQCVALCQEILSHDGGTPVGQPSDQPGAGGPEPRMRAGITPA